MEEISTSLWSLWEVFAARGMTVLALQLLVMVTAGVAAFFIHRYTQKSLVERLKSSDFPIAQSAAENRPAPGFSFKWFICLDDWASGLSSV